jgi:hypothetical protein
MMPAYAHNRASAIFFVIYLSVELYFLMNLVSFTFLGAGTLHGSAVTLEFSKGRGHKYDLIELHVDSTCTSLHLLTGKLFRPTYHFWKDHWLFK